MDESRDNLERLTTAQAAVRLGISEAGVRKRVQRGQIPHERDDTGRLWVYVARSETTGRQARDRDNESRDGPAEPLLEELRAHNATLQKQLEAERRANDENRRIIAALTQRIPAIEGPPETAQESPGSAAEADDRLRRRVGQEAAVDGVREGAERMSWRRRAALFVGLAMGAFVLWFVSVMVGLFFLQP